MLYESAYGYGLFERLESDEIGQGLDEVQQAMLDLSKFGKAIKLKAFLPFQSAAHALDNMNQVSEGNYIFIYLIYLFMLLVRFGS